MEPNAQKLCPSCHKPNDGSNRYCIQCGFDFDSVREPADTAAPQSPTQQNATYAPPPPQYTYYNTPPAGGPGYPPQNADYQVQMFYGGVDPDYMLEDVSAKEMAWFIKDNTGYYLPIFRKFQETGAKVHFNLASFFLSGGWLLYRRQIKNCILLYVITFVLSIPSLIFNLSQSGAAFFHALERGNYSYQYTIQSNAAITLFSMFCSLGIMVVFGLFGNYLYYRYCLRRIREIRLQSTDSRMYWSLIQQKGGSKLSNVFIAFAIIFGASLVLGVILGVVLAAITLAAM